MVCFDTDVLSVFLRAGATPAVQRRLVAALGEPQATTSITLGELLFGAQRRGSDRLARRIDELVRRALVVLPFDARAARTYASLKAELESAGLPLAEPDLRIASVAVARDLTLVTGNDRHFARVPGLRVENWL